MKNIIDELTSYRVKVEKEGKEIVNIPGILALPGALIAPTMSIVSTAAASLLGCSIHLENEAGKTVDVGEEIRKAADTIADAAKTAAKTAREEVEKAWNDLSADDPEGCPAGKENEDEEAASGEKPAENTDEEIAEDPEKQEADDIPTIHVENPDKPE